MPCDTRFKFRQTIAERKEEVKKVVEIFDRGLALGRVKVRVGPQGAVVFDGVSENERSGISDACAYRRIMSSGSFMAKLAIARAEAIAGRSIDRLRVGQGCHSHDGGVIWHDHKG